MSGGSTEGKRQGERAKKVTRARNVATASEARRLFKEEMGLELTATLLNENNIIAHLLVLSNSSSFNFHADF